ncbi:MAG: Ig-like domain-containing protein [Bdellovibrionota bacterium]
MSCTRNPLGEELSQTILNVTLKITEACPATGTQDVAYACTVTANNGAKTAVWVLLGGTTCDWAAMDSATGEITGTPDDSDVGSCQIVIRVETAEQAAVPVVVSLNIANVAPTLSVTNASSIAEDSGTTIIKTGASVQASEEGFGSYSLANSTTTAPRCSDNAIVLSIDASTGQVTYNPTLNYYGTCNIRIAFDDQNGLSDSQAVAEFAVTVNPVNDAPVVGAIAAQTIKTDAVTIVNYTLNDVDNTLDCASNVIVSSDNTVVIPNANLVKGGTFPNCMITITPSLNVVGAANISLAVGDGALSDLESFNLNTVNVTGLSLSPTSLNLINAGHTQQVQATASYSDGTTAVVTTSSFMNWSTSNPSVATVNNTTTKGAVTSVAAGNTTITATHKSVTAVASTSVVTMTGISISQSLINAGIGAVANITAQAIYTPLGTQDITSIATWSSANTAIASVSNGVITLNSAGTTTITVTYAGFSQSITVFVQNKSLISIAATPATHSMGVNAVQNYMATATYSDFSTANVTNSVVWSSTNPAVATISNTAPTIGRATALAGGSTLITATMGGLSHSVNLTADSSTLVSMVITPDNALVTSNGAYQLRATGTFSDSSTSDITEQVAWSSSNTSATTISNSSGSKGVATTPSFAGYRTAVITAMLGAVSDATPFGVNGATVTSVLVTPQVQVTAGSTYNLNAYANLSDGGTINVTDLSVWLSSNTSIFTISNGVGSKGLITGLSNGTASATANYNGTIGTRSVTVSATDAVTEVGTGLLGSYYNWTGGSPPVLSTAAFLPANKKGERIDARVNFSWAGGSAPMGVSDNFSVRWTGSYKATSTTNYFCTYSDDGVRLYINGFLVVNNWTNHGATWNCTANIPLTVGTKYSVVMEYFENGGSSEAHLTRSSVSATDAQSTGTRAVQQTDLYSN